MADEIFDACRFVLVTPRCIRSPEAESFSMAVYLFEMIIMVDHEGAHVSHLLYVTDVAVNLINEGPRYYYDLPTFSRPAVQR